MKNIKIVIGACWGDEAKGLMTDYFASKYDKSLVVLHNGSAQRGHTIVTPDFKEHIFHHFGSGTFNNNGKCVSDTYCADTFMVNPIEIIKEENDLYNLGIGNIPNLYINENCRIVTPYDMLLNQIKEKNRKENKHGSCGYGVYECFHRSSIPEYNLTAKDIIKGTYKEILSKIIDKYIPIELNKFNINNEDISLFSNDGIYNHYIHDLETVFNNHLTVDNEVLNTYDNVIFEGSQGLLLDQNNTEYYPHLTPSNTGLNNPMNIINLLGDIYQYDIEVIYIIRSYMTRHGAGRFDTECNRIELENLVNGNIYDTTNIPNEFQERLRFGFLDLETIKTAIAKDMTVNNIINKSNIKKSFAITHLDQTKNLLATNHGVVDLKDIDKNLLNLFNGDLYLSYGQTRNDIHKSCLKG